MARQTFTRLYFVSYEVLRLSFVVAAACFNGVWLALLSPARRYAIDRVYYDRERRYWTPEWNLQGLFDWEQRALAEFFGDRTRIAVLAAGGGREVIALRRRGLDVDGFEPHPGLAAFANDLMREGGLDATVHVSQRDGCPQFATHYDGAIVGWGAYTHIKGRQRRIALLRELRAGLLPGAPVLLSFFARGKARRRYRLTATVGNVVAAFARGERVEPGDYLMPTYAHYFTRAELAEEAAAAGFELVCFEFEPYAHAVLRALAVVPSTGGTAATADDAGGTPRVPSHPEPAGH